MARARIKSKAATAASKKPKSAKKLAAKSRVTPGLDEQRARMREILRVLDRNYPEAECSLTFSTPFQLLVATILSAQCTDERVNKVTPSLFASFPGPAEMASADLNEIEELIRTTGFFHNKALSIQQASQALIDRHSGEVPNDLEKLTALRGVGRKTANVVRGVAFGEAGLVVDTHVGRLSRRMGFTRDLDPVKVEHQMMEIVPRERWTDYAHLLISHGRAICTARRVMCEQCPISRLCPKTGV